MGRRPRVDRTAEEKWQIVQEGIKSGNLSETCRWHGISPSLLYPFRDSTMMGTSSSMVSAETIAIISALSSCSRRDGLCLCR